MLKSAFFTLCTVAIVFSIFNAIDNNSSIRPVIANKGIVDLSSLDFNNEVVSLKGQWTLYWKKLLKPDETDKSESFIQVPSSWNSDSRYDQNGFATYKIKLILPKNKGRRGYGLYLNRVGSAYKIYANGQLLGGNGVVGESEMIEVPHRETKLFYFDLMDNDDLDIIVQVSNHFHTNAGLKTSILFSQGNTLFRKSLGFFLVDFFTASVFLVIFVITFSIYVFRPDKRFLFLALVLLSGLFYIAGTGENIAVSLFPSIEWMPLMKIIHLCLALHILFYGFLLDDYCYAEKITVIALFFRVISLLFAVIVLVTPVSFFVSFLPLFHLVIILALVYWNFILIKASLNKNGGAPIILVGLVAYTISVILEVGYVNGFSHNPRLVPLGLLLLIFSYTIVYTRVFAKLYYIIENAEKEKRKAIAQANVEKEAFLAEKERSSFLQKTLTDSESISQIDKIRENLRRISYITSENGGCTAYDDLGKYLFNTDLTLKKITEIFRVNNQLIRCSKAYVVNPSKARKVVRNGRRYELQFLHSNLENIPVGNKYVSDVRDSIQAN